MTGAAVTQTASVNGTTGTDLTALGSVERVLRAEMAADAVGTVTVGRGTVASPGVTVRTIPPGERGFDLSFHASSSATIGRKIYYKLFIHNASAEDLLYARVGIAADPADVIKLGLEDAKDDGSSLANRLADGETLLGLSWTDDGVLAAVPSDTLASGEAIGAWLQMTLEANAVAFKNTVTLEIVGATA